MSKLFEIAEDVYGAVCTAVHSIKSRSAVHRFGKEFVSDEMSRTIDEVAKEYMLFDLRPTDVVLDIGAGIGAFSLMVCDHCKHVYAIEPLHHTKLLQNMYINNADTHNDITLFKTCLGKSGERNTIRFGYKKADIVCMSLSYMIKICGGNIDFIKCDCEGGEWTIKPHELSGVRRIEMEYHVLKTDVHERFDIERVLINAGFEYMIDNTNYSPINRNMTETGIIHAWRPPE